VLFRSRHSGSAVYNPSAQHRCDKQIGGPTVYVHTARESGAAGSSSISARDVTPQPGVVMARISGKTSYHATTYGPSEQYTNLTASHFVNFHPNALDLTTSNRVFDPHRKRHGKRKWEETSFGRPGQGGMNKSARVLSHVRGHLLGIDSRFAALPLQVPGVDGVVP
jgi:hypothetical protein